MLTQLLYFILLLNIIIKYILASITQPLAQRCAAIAERGTKWCRLKIFWTYKVECIMNHNFWYCDTMSPPESRPGTSLPPLSLSLSFSLSNMHEKTIPLSPNPWTPLPPAHSPLDLYLSNNSVRNVVPCLSLFSGQMFTPLIFTNCQNESSPEIKTQRTKSIFLRKRDHNLDVAPRHSAAWTEKKVPRNGHILPIRACTCNCIHRMHQVGL